MLVGGEGHGERGEEVEFDHARVPVRAGLGEQPWGCAARVVDEDVQPGQGGDEAPDGLGVPDVQRHELGCGVRDVRGVAGADDDAGAGPGEGARDAGADAPGPARDDGDLPVQLHPLLPST